MNFHFYEPVYFRQTNSDKINFVDESKERFGYWVGIVEKVCRSDDIRSANPDDPNRRAILEAGEEEKSANVSQILKSRR